MIDLVVQQVDRSVQDFQGALEAFHQVRKRRNRGGRSYAPVYAVGMILLLSGGSDGQPPAYCEVVSVDPLLCIPVGSF